MLHVPIKEVRHLLQVADPIVSRRTAEVVMRRVNPFIAQALIHFEQDGFVPLSVQLDLLAWDQGNLPSQREQ